MLIGWIPGIKTISLVQLITLRCGLGLIQAKTGVDSLINGIPQEFNFKNDELAMQFKEEAAALGAIAQ